MAGTAPYCGQCGKPSDGGHSGCLARAALEPPRYCPECARRMVVQVDPMGWRAVCSRHGERRG
jgi:predicted amidophosphoribosyltransferase